MFRGREVHVHRRAYKRSIGLTLQINGRIRISAPKSTPLSQIEAFLLSQAEWIETHLEKYRLMRAAYPPKEFREGESFIFLGSQLTLKFVHMQGSAGLLGSARSTVKVAVHDGKLLVGIPAERWAGFDVNAAHPELSRAVIDFYSREGRRVLAERVAHFSAQMELAPSALSFRAQKTRWGSCSSRGRISLNWRLIVAPSEVVDYVVVHELAHLRHYNHSRHFWNLVGTHVPEYVQLREWLRIHQYEADFLAKSSELHS